MKLFKNPFAGFNLEMMFVTPEDIKKQRESNREAKNKQVEELRQLLSKRFKECRKKESREYSKVIVEKISGLLDNSSYYKKDGTVHKTAVAKELKITRATLNRHLAEMDIEPINQEMREQKFLSDKRAIDIKKLLNNPSYYKDDGTVYKIAIVRKLGIDRITLNKYLAKISDRALKPP